LDIKSVILIGGGLLIAAVIAHGFWIAWRSRREPYRLDIVPDLIPDPVDDMERLRGELPNGGARLVGFGRRAGPRQDDLELDAPLLLDPLDEPPRARSAEARARRDAGGARAAPPLSRPAARQESYLQEDPLEREHLARQESRARHETRERARPVANEDDRREPPALAEPQDDGQSYAQVAEVTLDDDAIRATRPDRPERLNQRQSRSQAKGSTASPQGAARGGRNRLGREPSRAPAPAPEPVRELLIIHVLADGGRFEGPMILDAMQRLGLRYGDMNIFHRIDPASKVTQYSIANAVEPGTFDLSDLECLTTRGMTLFLQLPGPDEPGAALDDMLHTSEELAHLLGGVRRDENMSGLTVQTVAHYRQRIADFARRRLSMRA
jgi:cell division protein ZipA